MPTYEYVCTDCGESHEAVQRFSDSSLTMCPECGGRLRKVFSPVGVVFKGSGFYKTDSRKPGSHGDKPAKSDSKSETSSGTTSESKTESSSDKPAKSTDKPAKTADSKPAAAAS